MGSSPILALLSDFLISRFDVVPCPTSTAKSSLNAPATSPLQSPGAALSWTPTRQPDVHLPLHQAQAAAAGFSFATPCCPTGLGATAAATQPQLAPRQLSHTEVGETRPSAQVIFPQHAALIDCLLPCSSFCMPAWSHFSLYYCGLYRMQVRATIERLPSTYLYIYLCILYSILQAATAGTTARQRGSAEAMVLGDLTAYARCTIVLRCIRKR